jgi:hypothetical protein
MWPDGELRRSREARVYLPKNSAVRTLISIYKFAIADESTAVGCQIGIDKEPYRG